MLTNLSFCATQVPLFHAVVSLDPFCHPDISKIRITTKHLLLLCLTKYNKPELVSFLELSRLCLRIYSSR